MKIEEFDLHGYVPPSNAKYCRYCGSVMVAKQMIGYMFDPSTGVRINYPKNGREIKLMCATISEFTSEERAREICHDQAMFFSPDSPEVKK